MPEMPDAGSDALALWNASRDGVLEALDHEGIIKREGTYWFGDGTIEDILAFSQYDTLVHAWDLGQALGIDPHTSDDVAEMAVTAKTTSIACRARLFIDQVSHLNW